MGKKKTSENPFCLPIGATGLGRQDMLLRGLGIGMLGLITIVTCFIVGKFMRWSSVSYWEILSDTVFFFLRIPRLMQAFAADVKVVGWSQVLMIGGFVGFAFLASFQAASAAGQMSRLLSPQNVYPFSEGKARKVGRPLGFILVLCVLGAFTAWFALLHPSDSIALIIVRLFAIGFLLQLVSMLIGGAMASANTEGKKTAESLNRMFSLAWRKKGHFLRAVVYTLPRWQGVIFLSWCSVFAAIILPLIIGEHLLPMWLWFLRPLELFWLRLVRFIALVVSGLFLLAVWGTLIRTALAKAKPHPLLVPIAIVGLVATIWCLFILPFLVGHEPNSSTLWFSTARHFLLGQSFMGVSWQVKTCLFLVGIIVALNTATMIGTWLFLYPLATGVAAFFSLRRATEGKDYHSMAGTMQRSPQPLFSAPGAFLFTRGGASVLEAISPPRGWLALMWVGFRPKALGLSLLAVLAVFILMTVSSHTATSYRPIFWGLAAGLVMFVFLPLMCRETGQTLMVRRTNNQMVRPNQLPIRMLGAWAYFVLNIVFIAIGIGLGGSLGLIPKAGPILWGTFYVFMLLGANMIVVHLLRWILGSVMLPAVVATDIGPLDTATDVLKQTDYYAGARPWAFLGALVVGLLFSLAPSVVIGTCIFGYEAAYGLTEGYHWWVTLCMWCVLGLVGLGVAVALTNAYLTVKRSVGN